MEFRTIQSVTWHLTPDCLLHAFVAFDFAVADVDDSVGVGGDMLALSGMYRARGFGNEAGIEQK